MRQPHRREAQTRIAGAISKAKISSSENFTINNFFTRVYHSQNDTVPVPIQVTPSSSVKLLTISSPPKSLHTQRNFQ